MKFIAKKVWMKNVNNDKDNNKCKSCNAGFYLSEFEKNICQKCSIDNCLECYRNKTSNICIKCNAIENLKEYIY